MLLDPVRSVADFSFYAAAARRSTGRALGYLLYLGLIFATSATWAARVRLMPLWNEAVEWAATSIPPLTFADGKVIRSGRTAAPGDPRRSLIVPPGTAGSGIGPAAPLVLKYPKDESLVLVIDTDRAAPVAFDEMSRLKATVYLTRNALYLLGNDDRVESYELSKIPSSKPIVVDADFFRRLGSAFPKVFFPMLWFAAWLVFFVWKSLAALIYSLAAMLVNAALSAGLDYESLFRLSVYAQTPVVFLQCALLFMPRRVPGFFLLALLIVSVYLWQAVRQLRPAR